MNNLFFSLAAGSQGEIQFNSKSSFPAHMYIFFCCALPGCTMGSFAAISHMHVFLLVCFYISMLSAELEDISYS